MFIGSSKLLTLFPLRMLRSVCANLCREHVYRRHFMKNLCPRCFEHFDKPEDLKNHQRSEVPCKLRQMTIESISEEKEARLRKRAKAQSTEEEKWAEMYQIIYPGENVPSPCTFPRTTSSLRQFVNFSDHDMSAVASPPVESRWEDVEECKEYIRTELPKLVRKGLSDYLDTLFQDIQAKVDKKAAEVIEDVQTKLFMTVHFREDQAASAAPAPSSPRFDPILSGVGQFIEDMNHDPTYLELVNNLAYPVEDLLADPQGGAAFDNYSTDSAYYSTPSSNVTLFPDATYVPGFLG